MRSQTRWFGGMVGNHIADIVEKYGEEADFPPEVLIDYIRGRTGYDYNTHGKADNDHVDFVPDEIVDRFCILGTPPSSTSPSSRSSRTSASTSSRSTSSTTTRRRRCGSTGESIMPALREHVTAKA